VSGPDRREPRRRHATGGRPVYHLDEGGRFPLCPLDLYRQSGGGVCRAFTVTGGTGKFGKAMGESPFAVRSNVMDVVTTVPERDVTGSFTGQAAWGALKYTTP
jgi:hypothetical protein